MRHYTLYTDYSVREICDTLGFNWGFFLYYQPKSEPSDEVLRDEIQRLAARYPKYGYRRITKLLVRLGYPVGYRGVARFMKAEQSLDGQQQWRNRMDNLAITRCDQVWVGDMTYVRLKGHFVYVAVLMDVFTHMIRRWQVSRHLTEPLPLKPLEAALRQSVLEIHLNAYQGIHEARERIGHFITQVYQS